MKKVFAIMGIAALFLGGCAGQKGGSEEYAQVYLDKIAELNEAGKADLFALVDVDGDETPELAAISSEGSWDKDQVFLYTTDGAKAILLASDIGPGMEGHSIAFFEGKNLFVQRGAAMGDAFTFYMIENSQPVEVMSSYSGYMIDDNGEEIFAGTVDGNNVTEEEYYLAIKDRMENAGNIIELYSPENTEMLEEEVNFKNGSLNFNTIGGRAYNNYDDMKAQLENIRE